MAWMRWTFDIDPKYDANERKAIAQDVIDKIIERTQERRIDKRGVGFKKYTTGYENSLEFKVAGKTKGSRANLTLSGDMLADLKFLRSEEGKITIGFEKGTESNDKAEGNIKGTYGQSKPTGRARDFLGLPPTVLDEVRRKYPLNSARKRAERAAAILETIEGSKRVAEDIEGE